MIYQWTYKRRCARLRCVLVSSGVLSPPVWSRLSCDALQTDEARRWFVHQRLQQTPGSAVSAEIPGVSDREESQVGDFGEVLLKACFWKETVENFIQTAYLRNYRISQFGKYWQDERKVTEQSRLLYDQKPKSLGIWNIPEMDSVPRPIQQLFLKTSLKCVDNFSRSDKRRLSWVEVITLSLTLGASLTFCGKRPACPMMRFVID